MSFRLVSKSVTLNDLERLNSPYFALFHRIALQAYYVTVIEDRPAEYHLPLLAKTTWCTLQRDHSAIAEILVKCNSDCNKLLFKKLTSDLIRYFFTEYHLVIVTGSRQVRHGQCHRASYTVDV